MIFASKKISAAVRSSKNIVLIKDQDVIFVLNFLSDIFFEACHSREFY